MLDILLALLIETIVFVFFSIVGMVFIPRFDDENSTKNKISLFLLAPILGFAIWLGISGFLAFVCPFNRVTVFLLLFLVSLLIIAFRNKLLYFKEVFGVKKIFGYIVLIVLSSLLLIYIIVPGKINGGIYFRVGDYDHARVILVDSIINNGLPIKSPFISYNGKLLNGAYHMGIHIFMAQISLIFNVTSIISKAAVYGLIYVYTLLLCITIIYKFLNRKIVFLFMILLFLSHNIKDVNSFLNYLNDEVAGGFLFGFWSICDTLIWTAHHVLSAAIVLIIIYLYLILINKKSKTLLYYTLIGIATSGACVISIYAGAFSLIIFIFIFFIIYLFDKNFRNNFNKTFIYQFFAVIVGIICVSPFLNSLIKFSSNETKTIFEMLKLTLYKENFSNFLISFLKFYIINLPIKLGLVYILGFIMTIYLLVVSIKKKYILKKDKNVLDENIDNVALKIYLYYVVVSFALAFVIRSDFYSNDFGWRIVMASEIILICLASVFLTKTYDFLKMKNKIFLGIFIFIFLIISYFSIIGLKQDIIFVCKNNPKLHKEMANAVKGWDVIKKCTKKDDIVLCNPNAYSELYNDQRMLLNDGYGTNLFFTHYANRNSLIADYNYSRSFADSLLGKQSVKNLYNFAVKFFEGNPTIDDVEYLCDVQKVKAILVTPYDGLYNNKGSLMLKYPNKIDGIDFIVYFSNDIEIK